MEGTAVLEIDVSTIKVLQVEAYEDGVYVLSAHSDTQIFELNVGNFDECHHMLNKIHKTLGVELIDL
jgi:hypothetical protein